MPQVKNINTDYSVAVGDGHMLFKVCPNAERHLDHFKRQDRKINGIRAQLAKDDEDLRAKINESKVMEGRLDADYAKTGYPVRFDENDRKIEIDWREPFRKERARWMAAIEANRIARKKLGRTFGDDLRNFVATTRLAWREIEMPPVADERDAQVVITEREKPLDAITDEEIVVQNANRDDATIENNIRVECAGRKKMGAPKFGVLKQGGSFRHNGQFSAANPGARIQFATKAAIIHAADANTTVEIDDVLNFMLWADDGDKILKKLLAAARESNAGKLQISEADKVKKLRELGIKKLAAMRHLEVAYRAAEAAGVEVKRRNLAPEVLLWLERDTATRAVPTKPITKIEPDFEDDADDFERADADADADT